MIRVILVFCFLVSVPQGAFAHAEFFFSKVFSRAELPTTGFVLLNPDPDVATVYFYWIPSQGLPAGSPPPLSHPSFTIAAGGQFSALGSELFPTASGEGWVLAITDTESMQAFWLNYDERITWLDGAEAAGYDTIGPDQIIPFTAGVTELSVINPGAAKVPADHPDFR